jgi:hypothetical protein
LPCALDRVGSHQKRASAFHFITLAGSTQQQRKTVVLQRLLPAVLPDLKMTFSPERAGSPQYRAERLPCKFRAARSGGGRPGSTLQKEIVDVVWSKTVLKGEQ